MAQPEIRKEDLVVGTRYTIRYRNPAAQRMWHSGVFTRYTQPTAAEAAHGWGPEPVFNKIIINGDNKEPEERFWLGEVASPDKFYSYEAFNDAPPPPPPAIDVKRSELEPSDIFTGDEFKQGDRVIRIGEKNGWIFNRDELETWWKKKPNTNPLVSGTQQMAEGTKIEYGTLNILPSGGRRKTRRVQPKTKKQAKKTCSPGYEVYNFRKTRKGVFYDCAPKRKTRRSRK